MGPRKMKSYAVTPKILCNLDTSSYETLKKEQRVCEKKKIINIIYL